MAKKSENTVLLFVAGMVVILVLITAWNYATAPRYGMYGMSMGMMMGYRNADCASLSDDDMEAMGERMMGMMMDQDLHDQMDAQAKDERAMHILMVRMMTGCR